MPCPTALGTVISVIKIKKNKEQKTTLKILLDQTSNKVGYCKHKMLFYENTISKYCKCILVKLRVEKLSWSPFVNVFFYCYVLSFSSGAEWYKNDLSLKIWCWHLVINENKESKCFCDWAESDWSFLPAKNTANFFFEQLYKVIRSLKHCWEKRSDMESALFL